MWFWWFMFGCNLIYPGAMIVAGYYMWKHCPKEVNAYCGYRTKRSKLSAQTWKFANEDCGHRWWKYGWIMLIPTIIPQLFVIGKGVDAIGNLGTVICVVDCAVLLLSILPTEKKLKENFDAQGQKIEKK